MIRVDVVCPLYRAEKYMDTIFEGLQKQKEVEINNVVFALTEDGTPTDAIKAKIDAAGYTHFEVPVHKFSHSLTREKAIRDYCTQRVVIMMSQDVVIHDEYAFRNLAAAIAGDVVFAYGRQTVGNHSIERYIRESNYTGESAIIGEEDIERLQLGAFFASDAFSAYHRPTFLAIGGYDGDHMMMNEDMYYAKKVIDAGYKKAYVATAVVEHAHKFKLKQLYRRYYDTGIWFANHPEFDNYKTTDSGMKLAKRVFFKALKHFNIPVLVRFLPDMAARYLGMQKGRKVGKAEAKEHTAPAYEERREVAGYVPGEKYSEK